MTLFDYVALSILAASIVISLMRGLMREILSLLAWIAAFVVASLWARDMAALLPAAIPGDPLRLIVGFIILWVGTLFLGGLIASAVALLIRGAGLTAADRGMGAVFGLVRGVVIVLFLVILAGWSAMPKQPFWRHALLAPMAERAVHAMKPYLPDTWARYVHY